MLGVLVQVVRTTRHGVRQSRRVTATRPTRRAAGRAALTTSTSQVAYLRLTCPICDRYLCVLQVCSGSCKTTAVVVVVFDSVIHRYPVKAFYCK